MGKNSHIEWCDHSWNPWIGCTKVSAGCANCYAETMDKNRFSRTLGGGTKEEPISHWGKGAPRYRTKEANWREPLAWNREAKKGGVRSRVFCASAADVFDAEVPDEWRVDLFELVRLTPHLDWLLLTKRPENVGRGIIDSAQLALRGDKMDVYGWLCKWHHGHAPDNVWLGTSVEDQKAADERIPVLLQIPAKVRFLSCEPLLGTLALFQYWRDLPTRENPSGAFDQSDCWETWLDGLDWIIGGGESGQNARPCDPEWAQSLRDQCLEAANPPAFFWKQWGEHFPLDQWEHSPDLIVSDPDAQFAHVGKKRAGRLLDGETWDEIPDVTR